MSQVPVTVAQICKQAPPFTCTALLPDKSFKKISLSDYSNKWLLLFFYPLDFTFVCPTEIIEFSNLSQEFNKINVSIVGCSVDSEHTHHAWVETPRKKGGLGKINIPLLADVSRKIGRSYGVLLEEEGHTIRGTFLIDPKGIIRHLSMNDAPVGRNPSEYLRLVKGFQLSDSSGVVCPSSWKPGSDTIKPNQMDKNEYFKKQKE